MSVEEALGRMRLLLARRSVVARRLAAAADGPGEVRSPRLDGMPRGHGTRGGTLAVLGRMEALADECAEIEGELRALSARVEGPILALPPGPHRLVMRLRYLEWRAVSDVANGAGYERRYTYKLLEEGERRENLTVSDKQNATCRAGCLDRMRYHYNCLSCAVNL